MAVASSRFLVAAAAKESGERQAMRIAFRTGGVAGMFTVGLGLFGATVVVIMFKGNAPSVLEGFGFGAATHIGLSGEASGHFRTPADPDWSEADLAANSYGQGLSATPLQVLTAVSAIANGGRLMQPYIVQSIRDSSGDHPTKPVVVRQPISDQTAATLTSMMKAV